MKEFYINVNFEENTIETDLKKLVQNDYNSIKINFEIDKEYDKALFELKYPSGNTLQMLIKDNELILPRGILNEIDEYEYEISIYNEEGKLTHFKTKTFEVRKELVTDSEDIINDDRYPVLSDLINDVEKFKNEIKNDENLRGPEGKPGKTYDDTEIKNRLSKIEDVLFLKATAKVSIVNNVVTLTIKSNKVLQEMEEFTLSSDKKSLSKVLTENVGGEVTITSVDGQELTLTYETAPEITISISNQNEDGTTNKTNQPVIVTLTSNKEIQPIEGWNMSEDKKILTKTFYEVKVNNLTIYDLVGNSVNLKFNVTNVDTIAPEILKIDSSENADGSYLIKITTTELVSLNDRSWTWSGTHARLFKKNFTVEDLTKGVEEILVLIDKYDNKAYEKINISLIDNEVVATHEVIEHNEHTYGENIEVYEATANDTHNHIIKQICNVCKEEIILSNEIENCGKVLRQVEPTLPDLPVLPET